MLCRLQINPLLWLVLWFGCVLFDWWLSSFRPPHRPARPRDRQQPHRHHDHPVQQHWQRLVQSFHASGSQWATVFVAEAQRRAGVHRPAGHRQPHRGSLRENGLFGSALAAYQPPPGGKSEANFANCFQVYVAAFSISGYAWASWRYRYKPFNPVLGETYESHREDRGFHYISEQVIRSVDKVSQPGKPRSERAVMLCIISRLAITLPSLPVTHSQKTSLSGKVGAVWQRTARFSRWSESQAKGFLNNCQLCSVWLPVLRSEMEEQVLGEVSRDHLLWIGQCNSAQVSRCFIQRIQSHGAPQNT